MIGARFLVENVLTTRIIFTHIIVSPILGWSEIDYITNKTFKAFNYLYENILIFKYINIISQSTPFKHVVIYNDQ